MSIRIRTVGGVTVALCAAKSVAKSGDIYLDDTAHEALSYKFFRDFASECLLETTPTDWRHEEDAVIEAEENRNLNRDEWDKWIREMADRQDNTGVAG